MNYIKKIVGMTTSINVMVLFLDFIERLICLHTDPCFWLTHLKYKSGLVSFEIGLK